MYRIFASAFTADNTAAVNHAALALAARAVERNFDVRPVLAAGSYQGKYEQSLIFPVQNDDELHTAVWMFCEAFNQECIMVVSDDNQARLMSAAGMLEHIGTLYCHEVKGFPELFTGDFTYDGQHIWTVE